MLTRVLPRNGHAFHPIMRKGAVHQKSRKAERKAEKQHNAKKLKAVLSAAPDSID